MAISHTHANPLQYRVMSVLLPAKRKGPTAATMREREKETKKKKGRKDSPTRLDLHAGLDIYLIEPWERESISIFYHLFSIVCKKLAKFGFI